MFVKEFGRKIGAVGPANGMQFRMDAKLFEESLIVEWLEDFTIQFMNKVNVAFSTICKPQVVHESMDISGGNDSG